MAQTITERDVATFIRAAQWPNDVEGRLMCTTCTLADGHDYRAHCWRCEYLYAADYGRDARTHRC